MLKRHLAAFMLCCPHLPPSAIPSSRLLSNCHCYPAAVSYTANHSSADLVGKVPEQGQGGLQFAIFHNFLPFRNCFFCNCCLLVQVVCLLVPFASSVNAHHRNETQCQLTLYCLEELKTDDIHS